jgi:putative intracellular protease/amidase
MSANLNLPFPDRQKRVLLVVANPSVSATTGWPIGFWWAELTHPYWTFVESGYEVDIASPAGGVLQADAWSDPRDASGYSAHDLLSLGFIYSPSHMAMIEKTPSLAEIDPERYDALLLVGGQSPMYTFYKNEGLYRFVSSFYESGKVLAVVCHATSILLNLRLSNGELLVQGKTWTGFADSEEQYADAYVGRKIQPFWIEEEARKLTGTNFIVSGMFRSHAVRDGCLVTGQQQYSGAAAARLVVEAVGL